MSKFSAIVFCALAVGIVGQPCIAANDELVRRIDESLVKAADFITDAQSPDGIWRSETYGCFKEGFALTPYVMSGLPFIPVRRNKLDAAFDKGVVCLVNLVNDDGTINTPENGLMFPVYTAASASRVVALTDKSQRNLNAQKAWLNYLRKHQLAGNLGWKRADSTYGGWGFALHPPQRPENAEAMNPFLKSNLTATVFAAAALKSAKVPKSDSIWDDVLVFVKRCQNFSDDPFKSDPQFDDGGFMFCPDDGVGNKAGIAGTDRFGRMRYNSYGSMTGDGLRALLCCGLAKDHPRVVAARKWLERNFTVKTNPGKFPEDRKVLQNATYYYYLWAVAHSFTRLGVKEIDTPGGKVQWAAVLAEELIDQQREDGTWINRFTDAKEDDPLVATPWAAAVLANCRFVLSTPGELPDMGCPKVGTSDMKKTN